MWWRRCWLVRTMLARQGGVHPVERLRVTALVTQLAGAVGVGPPSRRVSYGVVSADPRLGGAGRSAHHGARECSGRPHDVYIGQD